MSMKKTPQNNIAGLVYIRTHVRKISGNLIDELPSHQREGQGRWTEQQVPLAQLTNARS